MKMFLTKAWFRIENGRTETGPRLTFKKGKKSGLVQVEEILKEMLQGLSLCLSFETK